MEFNIVYKTYKREIFKMVKSKVHDKELAEEITQDIFMRVYNHLNDFDESKSSLKTWIYNIGKRIVIDYWRKLKNDVIIFHCDSFTDKEGNELFTYTNNINPYTEYNNNELGENIHNAINELPINCKKIAYLSLIKDLSYNQISKSLNIPIGTVKATVFRAKEMLRNKLLNF